MARIQCDKMLAAVVLTLCAVAFTGQEARSAAREIDANPAIVRLSAEVARLESALAEAQEVRAQARVGCQTANRTLFDLEADFRKTRAAVRAAGLSRNLAVLLREKRRQVPESRELARGISEREARFEDVVVQLFEYRDRSEGWSIERVVADGLAETAPESTQADAAALANRLREYAVSAGDLLRRLVTLFEEMEEELREHDRFDRGLIEIASRYAAYIDARVLWVASAPPLDVSDLASSLRAVNCLCDGGEWKAVARALQSELAAQRAHVLAIVFVILILFGARRWLRPSRPYAPTQDATRVSVTLSALVYVAAAALPGAALIWAVGQVCGFAASRSTLADAVAIGLKAAAWVYLFFAGLCRLCAADGVAAIHFQWHAAVVTDLRRACRFGIVLLLPLFLLVSVLGAQPSPEHRDSLGRIAFIAAMLASAFLATRVLGLHGSLMEQARASRWSHWIARVAPIWNPLLFGAPVALALLAAAGYFHSARHLETRIRYTIAFLTLLGLGAALVRRWLIVARRKFAQDQARHEEDERQMELSVAGASGKAGALPQRLESHLHISVAKVDAQSSDLMRFLLALALLLGLGTIWSDTIPVLSALQRAQVWPELRLLPPQDDSLFESQRMVEGGDDNTPQTETRAAPVAGGEKRETGAAGGGLAQTPSAPRPARAGAPPTGTGTETASADSATPLTLGHLLVALVVLFVAAVASKNIPGLLEIAFLGRLPLDASARYAVSTIARYAVLFAGFWAALAALGISWKNVQWLAAALTFGLAFGLQEIFANFISGVIILIERPIRIGDIVTVGDTVGKVTRIRMRATTILDKNRRELLVPNKDFITQQLINWTLTDPITAVTVPVGIAYGSDTKLAQKLLLEAAAETPLILDDPPPRALFVRFGESSLDMELRACVSDYDESVDVSHELHERIEAKFREARIEIAFPQRDIHIRSGAAPPNA